MERGERGGDAAAGSTAEPTADAGSAGFRHAAAVVGSDAELLEIAVPVLEAALRSGDLVALSCPPDVVSLLCDALGEDGARITTDPELCLLGSRAPDALSRALQYAQRARDTPTGRVQVVALIDFGDDPADWREGRRFESACNRFMRDVPVSSLCLYDRRRLPQEVLDSAAATHPELLAGSSWAPNPAFQDPADYLAALPWPHDPVEDAPPVLAVDDAATLAGLRQELGAALAAHVPDSDQQEDLHLATSEVAANAFRHGSRPVSARVWSDGSRLVCAITDGGREFCDPLAGFRPAHGDDLSRGGMGLWLARKLWDSVDLLRGADGLTVRLSTRLHRPAGRP